MSRSATVTPGIGRVPGAGTLQEEGAGRSSGRPDTPPHVGEATPSAPSRFRRGVAWCAVRACRNRRGWLAFAVAASRPWTAERRGARVEPSVDDDVLAEIRHLTAPEDDTLAAVRARAEQSGDVPSPEIGSFLRWAAASVGARTVVEIGAAGGLTGLWLLRGMEERGVLTSVEHDPHRHGLAAAAYSEAGVTERVRSILGDPGTVLPRLSDDGYQLCLIQGRPSEYPMYLDHALRLLAPGGLLVARDVLVGGAAAADHLAEFTERLATDERLLTTVLPVGGGLALATLRA